VREHVLALFQKHLGRLRPSGGSNYLTTCPFHKEGREATPSFSVNVEKGAYHCFTCHRAGGVKRLLKELGVSRTQIDAETRSIEGYLERNAENRKLLRKNAFTERDPFRASPTLPEVLLAAYDHQPLKLIEDGFDPHLLDDMEVGYDRKSDRITYPLRDLYGNLAGISGGANQKGVNPKYKVYQGGHWNQSRMFVEGDFGKAFDEEFPGYTCENHQWLWNYDRVYPVITASSDPQAKVFVVEGFKAALWMMQAGFWNTVALMGSYISENQQRMLHRLGCPVVLFLDNDDAGRKGTLQVGDLLWRPMHGKVKVLPYPHEDVLASISNDDKTQPDDYEFDAIRTLEKQTMPFTQYFNYMRRLIPW
jgi:DNA primase